MPLASGQSRVVCERGLGPVVLRTERQGPQRGQGIHDRSTSVERVQQLAQVEPEQVEQVAEQIKRAVLLGRNVFEVSGNPVELLVERIENCDVFGIAANGPEPPRTMVRKSEPATTWSLDGPSQRGETATLVIRSDSISTTNREKGVSPCLMLHS